MWAKIKGWFSNAWKQVTGFFQKSKVVLAIVGVSIGFVIAVILVFLSRSNSNSQGNNIASDAAAIDSLDKRSGNLDKRSAEAVSNGQSLADRCDSLAKRRAELLGKLGQTN